MHFTFYSKIFGVHTVWLDWEPENFYKISAEERIIRASPGYK